MTFAKRLAAPASIVLTTFALAACGGGGGSSAPASTPTLQSSITSSNMQDVGAQGYTSTTNLNAQVGTSATSFVTGVSVDTASSGMLGVTLQELYRAIEAQATSGQVVGVTLSQTVPCASGGSLLVNATVASSGTISAGDTVTVTATGCVESGVTLNGAFSVNFKSITGIPGQSSSWNGTFGVTYTNFSIAQHGDTASVTGDLTLTVNQTSLGNATLSATGSSLSVSTTHNSTSASITVTNLNYGGSVASGVYTFHTNYTMSGNLGKLGNSTYTVKTLTDFKQTSTGFPSQGVLKITATDNSSLTLTAIDSTNVKLDLDKNGDGVTDDTTTTTWTNLQTHL
jgi:hypothetical protein